MNTTDPSEARIRQLIAEMAETAPAPDFDFGAVPESGTEPADTSDDTPASIQPESSFDPEEPVMIDLSESDIEATTPKTRKRWIAPVLGAAAAIVLILGIFMLSSDDGDDSDDGTDSVTAADPGMEPAQAAIGTWLLTIDLETAVDYETTVELEMNADGTYEITPGFHDFPEPPNGHDRDFGNYEIDGDVITLTSGASAGCPTPSGGVRLGKVGQYRLEFPAADLMTFVLIDDDCDSRFSFIPGAEFVRITRP
ncbi:MAG: hypothetical protein ACR2PK_18070 [Acidimicrobiales bacterium]